VGGRGGVRPQFFVYENEGELSTLAIGKIGKKRLNPNSLERF
jgi:hypothetical protein